MSASSFCALFYRHEVFASHEPIVHHVVDFWKSKEEFYSKLIFLKEREFCSIF